MHRCNRGHAARARVVLVMGFGVTTRARRLGGRRGPWQPVALAGTVQVDGYGIAYRTAGTAEAHSHTVVLLHGMAGSSDLWEAAMAALAGRAYQVAVDLPGHGRSEGPGASSVAEYSAFLLRAFTALGLVRPVVLVGHCLGACIALELAAGHPDRVLGIVVSGIGAGPGVDEGALAAARRGEWDPRFWGRRIDSALAPTAAAAVVRGWQSTRPEVRLGDLLACAHFDPLAVACRVRAPALVVAGAQDGVVAPPAAASLARAFPSGTLASLPGAGPLPMLAAPDLYSQVVGQFLETLPQGPALRPPGW